MSNTEKIKLRKHILKLLRNQKEKERLTKSLAIEQKLFEVPSFKAAKTILFYASFDGEVSTESLVIKAKEMSKNVVLPKINRATNTITPYLVNNLDEDLIKGAYGIKEPNENKTKQMAAAEIDCAVIPGIAFDRSNYRLGRGGGYYDRFLPLLSQTAVIFGLAFDFQIVDQLPCLEQHDFPVNHVVTN